MIKIHNKIWYVKKPNHDRSWHYVRGKLIDVEFKE